MSTKKIIATTGSPKRKEKPAQQTQRNAKRTVEVLESDLEESGPKKG